MLFIPPDNKNSSRILQVFIIKGVWFVLGGQDYFASITFDTNVSKMCYQQKLSRHPSQKRAENVVSLFHRDIPQTYCKPSDAKPWQPMGQDQRSVLANT